MAARKSIRVMAKVAVGWAVGALIYSGAQADTLRHIDGTQVEGKIIYETPDEIRIQTKYGTLTYDRADLAKIQRSPAAGAAATAAAATPTPINLAEKIPAGPINPFAPPAVQPLVQFGARLTSASASAATPAAPTPAASPTAAPKP